MNETILFGVDAEYLQHEAPVGILSALDLGYRVHVVYEDGANDATLLEHVGQNSLLTCETQKVPQGRSNPSYFSTIRLRALSTLLRERQHVWVMDADLVFTKAMPRPSAFVMLYLDNWTKMGEHLKARANHYDLPGQWVFEGTLISCNGAGFNGQVGQAWAQYIVKVLESSPDRFFADQRALFLTWCHFLAVDVEYLPPTAFSHAHNRVADTCFYGPTPEQRRGEGTNIWSKTRQSYLDRWN